MDNTDSLNDATLQTNTNRIESYKLLFETSKHLTTLNTATLIFLASLAQGFITGESMSNMYSWMAFGSFLFSITTCVLAMLQLSLAVRIRNETRSRNEAILPVTAFAFYIAGLLLLGSAAY